MGGFYGGTNHYSGSNSNYSSNDSHADDYHCCRCHHYYNPGHPIFNIGTGMFFLVLDVFMVYLISQAEIELAAKIFIATIMFLFFTIAGVAIIIINIKRYQKEKEEIKETIDINKIDIDSFLNSISKDSTKVYAKTEEPKSNRIITRSATIVGYVLMGLGLVLFLLLNQVKVKATVTSKYETSSEVSYSFTYSYNGAPYSGQGSDKKEYSSMITEGSQYYIYVSMVNPSHYEFEYNAAPMITLFVFLILGSAFLGYGIIQRKKYLVSIKFVGDLNHDGKIDEEDYKIYKNGGGVEVEFENVSKSKFKYCPYCGERLVNLSYCGACHTRIK
jgi:hypothetical protein